MVFMMQLQILLLFNVIYKHEYHWVSAVPVMQKKRLKRPLPALESYIKLPQHSPS